MFTQYAAQMIKTFALALTIGIAAPATRADDALTGRNKTLVRDFYTTVLIERNVDAAAPRFLRADYIQHNAQVPTGLKGFMDTFRERFAQKLPSDYKGELLNVIGQFQKAVSSSSDWTIWRCPFVCAARIQRPPSDVPVLQYSHAQPSCKLRLTINRGQTAR